jgi:hypothetical protein
MSDDAVDWPVIEIRLPEPQSFDAARVGGGLCAACGRDLAEGEPVWLERIPVPGNPKALLRVTVGRECASPAFLARTEGQEPEPCAGCGRGVHYGKSNIKRSRALCSTRCVTRVRAADGRSRRETEAMENEMERRDLVQEAQEIEQDVAPRSGPGEEEAPTEESAHD